MTDLHLTRAENTVFKAIESLIEKRATENLPSDFDTKLNVILANPTPEKITKNLHTLLDDRESFFRKQTLLNDSSYLRYDNSLRGYQTAANKVYYLLIDLKNNMKKVPLKSGVVLFALSTLAWVGFSGRDKTA